MSGVYVECPDCGTLQAHHSESSIADCVICNRRWDTSPSRCVRVLHVALWPISKALDLVFGKPVRANEAYPDR